MNYVEHHLGDYAKNTLKLSMIEDGAYRRLLDAYYIDEAPIAAKDRYKAARATTRAEKAAVDEVLARYFVLVDSVFTHARCDEEIAKFHAKPKKAPDVSEHTRERQARARERRKAMFSALRAANIVPPFDATTGDLLDLMERHHVTLPVTATVTAPQSPVPSPQLIQRPVVTAVAVVEPKPTAPRPAKKCPPSFMVEPPLLEWAAQKLPGMAVTDLRYETEKFRDHTFKTARTDWPATWRAWMRKANEDRQKRNSHAGEPAWRTEQRARVQQAAPYAATRPIDELFDDDQPPRINHDLPRS